MSSVHLETGPRGQVVPIYEIQTRSSSPVLALRVPPQDDPDGGEPGRDDGAVDEEPEPPDEALVVQAANRGHGRHRGLKNDIRNLKSEILVADVYRTPLDLRF